MPGDLFTQMRTVFSLQRTLIWDRGIKGEKDLPKLLTTRDVLEFATVEGAKANKLDKKIGTLTPGQSLLLGDIYWEDRLHKLQDVTSVKHEGAGMYRVLTSNGSRTTTELVEMAVQANSAVKSLSVQNTTLDDVFVHYTGRALRDDGVPRGLVAHAHGTRRRGDGAGDDEVRGPHRVAAGRRARVLRHRGRRIDGRAAADH